LFFFEVFCKIVIGLVLWFVWCGGGGGGGFSPTDS